MSVHSAQPTTLSSADVQLNDAASKGIMVAGGLGVIGLVASFALGAAEHDNWKNFLFSYHTAFIYFISISLGALFFVIIQHLVKAGWSVVVRRLAELVAANIGLMVLLFLPIAVLSFTGNSSLFVWLNPEMQQHDHLVHGKVAYLNQGFFIIRLLIYFGFWGGLSWYYLRTSVKQDETGDPSLTLRMKNISSPGIVLFALTITFFAFDTLMSLDPHWFSTIWGVCFFATSVVGFFAFLALFARHLQQLGNLKTIINAEHYHDIGKLLFAFLLFWAYVNFSQFLLIWYANLPEETIYYLHRIKGGWFAVGMVLVFGHFVIPFVGLISRWAKRIPNLLCFWSAWLLIMHYFDILYMTKPNMDPTGVHIGLLDAACLVGVGGLFIANLLRMAKKYALVPVKDPRLAESLTFLNN